MFDSAFPRSAEYVAFYREVSEEVHSRGLLLLVESGPVFPDAQYSNVRYDWARLTPQAFFEQRRRQLQTIAEEVKPDLLSISSEIGTEVMLTGLDFSTSQYMDFVREAAEDLGGFPATREGAGAGSWEREDYLRALVKGPGLQFVNTHIYPLSNGRTESVEWADQAAALAASYGKEVVIGEAWLYKATPGELGDRISYQQAYGRDACSFWQPLDVRFIHAIAQLAARRDVRYVSFFWSGFFSSCLEFQGPRGSSSMVDLYRQLNQAQFNAP
ncbi:MAG: hypothetical protein NTY23_02850 [Chloroflexi bacterium]|nr:hypothetical protein [Chloroflexota bacterium]